VHPTPISAALFILASGGSAYLLSGLIGLPASTVPRGLSCLVLWEAIQLIPVHLLATLQMLGWATRVTVPALAEMEAAILAGASVWAWARGRSAPAGPNTESRVDGPLPVYILAAAAVLLGSYLIFAADVFTGFPTGSDAVIYHLPLAVRWLQDGSLAIPASRVWRYSMPGNAEIGMMILLSSGQQSTTVMASWIPALMVTASTYLLAMWISKGNRLASITACLIVLSIPMIEFQVFSAYVDLLGTAGVLAAFALILSASGEEPGDKPAVLAPALSLVSGLACGISLGTKPIYYLHAAVFSVFTAYVFWANRDRGKKALLKPAMLVVLGMLLPSVFWFARALKETGNPVYPMQVKVAQRVIFAGYKPSQLGDFREFDFVRQRREWPAYPWTEWKRNPGYLKVPYAEGAGFGAVFATFVPLGVLFFFVRNCVLRQESRRDWILLFVFATLLLSWWIWMERVPRYGQVVWVFACILSVPLIVVLQSRRRGLATLMTGSIIATSVVCASVPLHSMAGRLRKHLWSRAQIYNYPQAIDALPVGSVVLNATGIGEKNFALAGRQLTNRVIPDFEAPSELAAQSLCAIGADYVVEVVPGGRYSEPSLVSSGATAMDDELVVTGEDRVRWRIWRVGKEK
jgi:hypothetical protein